MAGALLAGGLQAPDELGFVDLQVDGKGCGLQQCYVVWGAGCASACGDDCWLRLGGIAGLFKYLLEVERFGLPKPGLSPILKDFDNCLPCGLLNVLVEVYEGCLQVLG